MSFERMETETNAAFSEAVKIERKMYETKEGVPIEIACREFNPEKVTSEGEDAKRKEVVFLPGVGIDAETKTAQSVAEAYARSSESKTYVITSKIRKKVEDSLYEQASAIAKLIREKGMSEVTLVGHSQGGDKAVDLASILQKEKDFKINGLVLLDSVGLYDQRPGDLAKGFVKDALLNTPPSLATAKRDRLSGIKKGMIAGTEVLFGIAKDIYRIWRTQPDYKGRIAAEVEELAKMNPRLGEIESPIILISGMGDPISDPEKLVPTAAEEQIRLKNDKAMTYTNPREEYLKQTLFPKSPYVRMIAPEKLGHHGIPFFRTESIANASLYLLKRFQRSQDKKIS